jgi:aminoglycoside phosphotransferase (APT) family kinase protein
MHRDQIPIDVETARRLIAEQFPQFRDERIERLGVLGTDNAVFGIGSRAAARFPLRFGDRGECADRLCREAAAMAEFAGCSPVPSPRPIGLGRPGPGYPMPWSVQTWVEGEVATPDGLAGARSFARDIAELVAALRRADTRGRRGRLPDHDDWMATCLRNSHGLLDVPRLQALWTRLRALPAPDTETMCHRDLIPGNLLVRNGRLAGVLDSGGFGPADPALDLVAAWHLLDRERRALVRTRLGSDPVEWRRGAAWAFQQAMGLVWYYRESNRAMAELGRSTLARLLDDPDV